VNDEVFGYRGHDGRRRVCRRRRRPGHGASGDHATDSQSAGIGRFVAAHHKGSKHQMAAKHHKSSKAPADTAPAAATPQ
jgi:hypothetical protein